MTTLQPDAATTSVIWMTPKEIDRILSARGTTAPVPGVRSFRSDADVRSSGQPTKEFWAALVLGAALVSFLAALRPRSVAQPAVPAARAPRSQSGADGLVEQVRHGLSELSVEDTRRRASEITERLSTELGRLTLDGLPPLHSNVGSGGAFLIEWTIGRRRIGLNIEPDPRDSSWFYVSMDGSDVASSCGPLTELDLPVLLRRLVQR